MATTPPQEDPQQIIETDPSVRSSSPSFYSYSLLIGSKLEGDNDSALGDDVYVSVIDWTTFLIVDIR